MSNGNLDSNINTHPIAFRVATYNVALYGQHEGELIHRLKTNDGNAHAIAAVLQRVRPDVVLLNEFDYDPLHQAADLFQRQYLEKPQPLGGTALHYPYRYLAPVNAGVDSGLDLDLDGKIKGPGDAWGYGLYPGQYGMLILSRHPIDIENIRSFQNFRWSLMPHARSPIDPTTGHDTYPDAIWEQLRLSSKSHWDVPIRISGETVHLLASHPTPPVFDGLERRNHVRNRDEILFWRDYLTPDGKQSWLCDDQNRCGGLEASKRFVILGDLNNDPVNGAGDHSAIIELLEHYRVMRYPTPRSMGSAEASQRYIAEGMTHRGSPEHATSDFGSNVGTLRLDYVLPSSGFRFLGSGVFWPTSDRPEAAIAAASDHRLVWVDLIP
ncbi:MAG: endonuclease/exonuclease/phosphatase family protein [Xanthomonadaceae bacterium]|jgi:endonuclease/exonuclease/phosphatase family metal-dependent hydrolase|nr:endonuclease/exonuclease/phosphatase family protein [Xanthomonadaceae bacterium]